MSSDSSKISGLEDKIKEFGIDETILEAIKKTADSRQYTTILRDIYASYKEKK